MKRINLEEICEFVLDGTHGSPVRVDSGIPVYSAKNVTDNGFTEITDRFTTNEEFEKFNKRLPLRIGDVLITIVGTIGRVAILNVETPMVFQRSIGVLRPKQEFVTSKYLYHYLRTNDVKAQIQTRINKSTQAGIYLGKLKTVEIDVPSLDKQNEITTILDKVLTGKENAESLQQKYELAYLAFSQMLLENEN